METYTPVKNEDIIRELNELLNEKPSEESSVKGDEKIQSHPPNNIAASEETIFNQEPRSEEVIPAEDKV